MPTVFQPDFRMPHDAPAHTSASGASAATTASAAITAITAITPEDTRHYFTEVAVDYSAWSPSYNMHFGFWRAGLNPLRREGMLVEMNRVIGRALRLPAQQLASPQGSAPRRCVLDLGCGAGATARTLVGDDPSLYAITVTNVAVQNRIAARLDAAAGVADRMAHLEADYTRTGLPAAQADGAWAVESACYAEGTAKADFVREAARLLKPGARLAVVDGFLLRREPGRLAGWLHRLWADSWAVPTLAVREDFVAALRAHGFEDIQVKSLRWRVAPSALHIPVLATRFALAELWKARGKLSPWRRKHIVASYCALALGMFWRDFDYCMVTAKRRAD
jgi:SAM-dependent methyltransferase